METTARTTPQRCYRIAGDLGALGVVVDAIDDAARTFYERFEFSRFPERPCQLFLPIRTISNLIGRPE